MRHLLRFSLPSLAAFGFAGAIACAGRGPTPEAKPKPAKETTHRRPTLAKAPLPEANPKLPPVPSVEGELHISVVYPPENALITSRDSNFIFGSVGNGAAGLTINGALVPVWPNGAFMGWVANPPIDAQQYDLVAYTLTDTVRRTYHVRTRAALPPTPARQDTVVPIMPAQYATLHDDSLERAVSDTDQVIIGRPTPTGTYKWFLFPGTPVRVTGTLGDKARVELDGAQTIWVDRRVIKPSAPPPAPPTKSTMRAATIQSPGTSVGPATYASQSDWFDVTIPAALPPAYIVDESERGLTLTLYAPTRDETSPRVSLPGGESYVTDVRFESSATRSVYHFELSRPTYGYLALYHDGVMTFRIRRPPVTNPDHPLRGLTIVVDPGHPPAGANGPTGLYEAVATLNVGMRLRDLLDAEGAHVVMTRTSSGPVALGDRPIRARRENANALVSVHLNALPDGMNPFRSHGTGTYYFHTLSQRYASFVQESLVPELGLRDLGTFRENLALVRPTWMPSVLTEGVFIIMPDQEAAIRTPEYQEAYARGIVRGLTRFFATFAQ